MDIDSIFSTLLSATFGGAPFGVIDSSVEIGRRVQQFIFPGVDAPSFQDLGADYGPIVVNGILAGDDYLAQMRNLVNICSQPGPYTLVHPWLGTSQVVFVPGQRVKISLVSTELRIARFTMQLLNYAPPAGAGLDTLSQLEVDCDEATAAAQNYLASALAPIGSVLGALSYAQTYLVGLESTAQQAIAGTASAGIIGAQAAAALVGLVVVTVGAPSAWAAATAAAMVALPAAIEQAGAPLVPSAVAPGGSSAAAQAASATDTTNTLLAAAAGAAVASGSPAPGPALGAGMQAALVAAAVQAASRITYTSQQDAEAQAALLYAAIDAAAVAAAALAQTDPANAAPVWRAMVVMKGSLAADVNSLIGRLPPVVTITTEATMPAWILAQYISGDTPRAVYATYLDLISRNAVLNPALVQPGMLEVLA
jgi:prophage DNA circulation protein